MSRRVTRLLTTVGLTVVALAPCLVTPGPASAGSYAYWSYWHDTGAGWKYSGCGAYYSQGDCVPADGTLDGWRFTVSSEGGATPPRYSAGFAKACESTAPKSGTKRVAIIVDYGTQADASNRPIAARCATGGPQDNGGALLEQQFRITASQGFICSIESYPKSGCGDYIADNPSPRPTKTARPAPAPPPASPAAQVTTAPVTPGVSVAPATPPPTASTVASAAPRTTEVPTPDASASEQAAPIVFGGAPSKSSHGSPVGSLLGIAVIAAGASAAVVFARRRRSR